MQVPNEYAKCEATDNLSDTKVDDVGRFLYTTTAAYKHGQFTSLL